MTYHGTGRASLENALTRALGREKGREERAAREQPVSYKKVRDPVSYQQAVVSRKALGLPVPKPLSKEQQHLRFITSSSKATTKKKRAKVSLTGVDRTPQRSEREIVEEATSKAVRDAIIRMQGYLEHILDTPEPVRYIAAIDPRGMIDALTALGLSIRPIVRFELKPRRKRFRPEGDDEEGDF